MTNSFQVYGLKTDVIKEGDDLAAVLELAARNVAGGFQPGDVLVAAETAVATAEGDITRLYEVNPTERARDLGTRFQMDPRLVEIVLQESDLVVGGIPGFLLCMKNGTLLPNAGIDGSNAPPGTVVKLPADPDGSAEALRKEIENRYNVRIGVIIADSRTHAMRLGCGGVAIGCSGIDAVRDERGRRDLYGRELEVTKAAIADNIASASELVMGEADECVPGALIRGLGLPINEAKGIEGISASECLFMGVALDAYPAILNRERKSHIL